MVFVDFISRFKNKNVRINNAFGITCNLSNVVIDTYVEITEDNGKTWKELGNYTINFESFDYQLQKINLSAYANKTVKIRFLGDSDKLKQI
jgi:Neuraminidase (sialidase)